MDIVISVGKHEQQKTPGVQCYWYKAWDDIRDWYIKVPTIFLSIHLLTLWDSMGGTGEHRAKWNKPDSERQIPYDLTYKWNLINKTNRQAKYNQRHGNKEQTESNQRGRGGEYWGKIRKGSSRNMYKGHRDKATGGRFEGGRQGRVGRKGMVGGEMEKTVLEQQ